MSSDPNIKNVTPSEAKQLVDDGYTYVDVRSIPEFEQGHAEGALNVPIQHLIAGGMQPNPEFLKVMQANFAPDTKLVLGCKSGGRSMRAAEMLSRAGYTDVVNMDGGFGGRYDAYGSLQQAGWAEAGLPVSTDSTGDGAYEALAAKAK